MHKFKRKNELNFEMPLFFKLWFAFVFLGAISIFSFVGYMFYLGLTNMPTNPEDVGRFIGKIQSGYEESVSK